MISLQLINSVLLYSIFSEINNKINKFSEVVSHIPTYLSVLSANLNWHPSYDNFSFLLIFVSFEFPSTILQDYRCPPGVKRGPPQPRIVGLVFHLP